MAFPDIMAQPTYTLTLPASNKTISYRPFLEKERKILLMALESGQDTDIINAVKAVLKSCCTSKDIDVTKLPVIDVETFFLHLRAKSIGEIIPLTFRCENVIVENMTEQKCGNQMKFDVDVTSISVENLKSDKDRIIELSSELKIKMNYPTFFDSSMDSNSIEFLYELLANCIEFIAYGEEIYYAKEYTTDELVNFMENLTPVQFKKLEEYINDVPRLKKVVEHTCKKCGFKHTITMEGLQSFFA